MRQAMALFLPRLRFYQAPIAEGLDYPSFGNDGEDEGLDLPTARYVEIPPHSGADIETGLYCAIPRGYYIYICAKGSSAKWGISFPFEIIDQGYTGPWTLWAWNGSDKSVYVPREKCIAQAILRRSQRARIVPTSLKQMDSVKTKRKDGRMNSSGKGLDV